MTTIGAEDGGLGGAGVVLTLLNQDGVTGKNPGSGLGLSKVEGKNNFRASLFLSNSGGAGRILTMPFVLVLEVLVGAKMGSRYGAS